MNKAILKFINLDCPTCIMKIETALKETMGVANVKSLFNARKAVVNYDESQLTPEELIEIVKGLGYEASLVKTA